MKTMKKWIAGATLMAMAATSANSLDAQEYYSDCSDGWGYQDSCCSPCLTPYIALGTIAVIAIIVLSVRHHGGGGGSHAH